MKTPSKLLHPAYYNEFHCIGGACENNCCGGWSITIDKSTYLKYKKVKDPQLAEKFERYVKRTKDGNPRAYAYFQLREDRQCPFQQEDGLCEIHGKMGHSALCHTCKIYPRQHSFLIPDYMEASLMMSCPEAIRVALLQPDPITFEVSPTEIAATDLVLRNCNVPNTSEENGTPAYLIWEIREACIDILQSRSMPLPDRLFALGMFLRKVSELREENQLDKISKTVLVYVKAAQEGEFLGKLHSYAFDEEIYVAMRRLAIENCLRGAVKAMGNPNYKIYTQFANAYGKERGGDFTFTSDAEGIKDFHQFVESREKLHWDKFLSEKSYVLENYFVNMVFGTNLPFTYQSSLSIYQHFILLAHQYAQCKMLLSATTEAGEEVTDERIISTFLCLTIASQHNDDLKEMCAGYQRIGGDTLAHIAYLLH